MIRYAYQRTKINEQGTEQQNLMLIAHCLLLIKATPGSA
jgi:hypothetical protein